MLLYEIVTGQIQRGDRMSYIVPRDKPKECYKCPFMDRITYDCRLMYSNDYPDFESQYKDCPLVEISFGEEQMEAVNEQLKER